MSTEHGTWPRQIRLPGQAAAPEGPIDMQMMYLMHHAFRRDLARFCEAVRRTPIGDRETWTALEERWELFAEILHKHHTGEDDGLWPWLRERAEPGEVAVLAAMEAEHAEIDPLLESCASGFRRLATHADEDARSALAVRVSAARQSLDRHLGHEETDAIAIVQRLMSAEDWERLEEEHFRKDASLPYVARVVPWVAEDLPREVVSGVLAAGGMPVKVLFRLTRGRFARREAKAFAYA